MLYIEYGMPLPKEVVFSLLYFTACHLSPARRSEKKPIGVPPQVPTRIPTHFAQRQSKWTECERLFVAFILLL